MDTQPRHRAPTAAPSHSFCSAHAGQASASLPAGCRLSPARPGTTSHPPGDRRGGQQRGWQASVRRRRRRRRRRCLPPRSTLLLPRGAFPASLQASARGWIDLAWHCVWLHRHRGWVGALGHSHCPASAAAPPPAPRLGFPPPAPFPPCAVRLPLTSRVLGGPTWVLLQWARWCSTRR